MNSADGIGIGKLPRRPFRRSFSGGGKCGRIYKEQCEEDKIV